MSSISAASDDDKVVAALYHEREGERERRIVIAPVIEVVS